MAITEEKRKLTEKSWKLRKGGFLKLIGQAENIMTNIYSTEE